MIHQKLFSVMGLRVTHFSEAWTGYGVSTRFVFFSELFLHCAALYVLDCHNSQGIFIIVVNFS
jgi:hypothetical protein